MYSKTYEARLNRTLNAIAMKPVDKIPLSYNGPAYMARESGLTMAEYVHDFSKATQAAVDFCHRHPCIDSMHTPLIMPRTMSGLWMSPCRLPGEELGEDELWQLEEQETIRFEDYEDILKEGWDSWSARALKERLGDPMSAIGPFLAAQPMAFRRLKEECGVPVLNPGNAGAPFENLCGGRTLMRFFVDILEEPELVKAVLDNVMDSARRRYIAELEASRPLGVWVGGWRAAPELMGHDMWMEFAWPYIREMVEITVAHGAIPILHFDSCWDRELETLKELPARTCLLMLDGTTDIRKARHVLGDHMCILGDVPSHLMAFGSEDDVYRYTAKLIDDVGPKTGLMVSSGCDVPLNARPENVRAMMQAVEDYSL